MFHVEHKEIKLNKEILDAKLKSNHYAGELIKALEKNYPLGSIIKFYIKYGQKNPSTGKVIGYSRDAEVRVFHLEAKERSRYSHRYIHYENIL